MEQHNVTEMPVVPAPEQPAVPAPQPVPQPAPQPVPPPQVVGAATAMEPATTPTLEIQFGEIVNVVAGMGVRIEALEAEVQALKANPQPSAAVRVAPPRQPGEAPPKAPSASNPHGVPRDAVAGDECPTCGFALEHGKYGVYCRVGWEDQKRASGQWDANYRSGQQAQQPVYAPPPPNVQPAPYYPQQQAQPPVYVPEQPPAYAPPPQQPPAYIPPPQAGV